MFHRSELGDHGHKFPVDLDLHIPEPGDDWRQMKYDHGPNDPDEPGISPEEKQRRIEFLDKIWWPQVLAQVATEHQQLPEGSFIKSWQRNVQAPPTKTGGFEAADSDDFR